MSKQTLPTFSGMLSPHRARYGTCKSVAAVQKSIMVVWIMNRSGVLYRILRAGMDGWSRLFPMCASVMLIFLGFLNLVGAPQSDLFDLRSFLHISEILVLTLLSPLLIMRPANVLALFLISYLLTKMTLAGGSFAQAAPAVLILFCCLGILLTLGDQLPWLRRRREDSFGERLRSVLLLFLSLASCAIVLVAMFKVGGFTRWFVAHTGFALAPQIILVGLALLLVLWLMVSMNIVSPMFLSFLALPTFTIALYLTGLTSTALITPFIVCLALATTVPTNQQWSQS